MREKISITMQMEIIVKMKGYKIENLFTVTSANTKEKIIDYGIAPNDVFSKGNYQYYILYGKNNILGFSRSYLTKSIYTWEENQITFNKGKLQFDIEYNEGLPINTIFCCDKTYSTNEMCKIVGKKIEGLKIVKLHEPSVRNYPNERGLLFQLEDGLELFMSIELSNARFSSIVLYNEVQIRKELLDNIEYITVF